MNFTDISLEHHIRVQDQVMFEGDSVMFVGADGIFKGKIIAFGLLNDSKVIEIMLENGEKGYIKLEDLIYICKDEEENVKKIEQVYSWVVFCEYEKLLKLYKEAVKRGMKDLPALEEFMSVINYKWNYMIDDDKEKVEQIIEIIDSLIMETRIE